MSNDQQYYRSSLSAAAAVPLTPLIDVVFLVVIFFMVSATFAVQSTVPVQLPHAAADPPDAAALFAITVDEAGQIFVAQGGTAQPETLDTLRAALDRWQAAEAADGVVLHGDARASYGRLVAVMDVIRSTGVTDIRLVTAYPEAPR
jgi:biopolymer transport protein ExbD